MIDRFDSREMIDAPNSGNTDRVRAIELDPAGGRYPDLHAVFTYWDDKRRARIAPTRADIDPIDLISVLPRTMLADVLSEPLDFRYRLAGTAIRDIHGWELTGKHPRDLSPPAYAALIFAHYSDCVRRRRPLLHLIELDTHESSRAYARLLLPLSEDGANVTMLMAVDGKEQNSQALKNFFTQTAQR